MTELINEILLFIHILVHKDQQSLSISTHQISRRVLFALSGQQDSSDEERAAGPS